MSRVELTNIHKYFKSTTSILTILAPMVNGPTLSEHVHEYSFPSSNDQSSKYFILKMPSGVIFWDIYSQFHKFNLHVALRWALNHEDLNLNSPWDTFSKLASG